MFSRCNPYNPKIPKRDLGWPWMACSDYVYVYTPLYISAYVHLPQAPYYRHSGLRHTTMTSLMKSKVLCTPAQPPDRLCRPGDKGRHPTCVTLHVHAALRACAATLWRECTRLIRLRYLLRLDSVIHCRYTAIHGAIVSALRSSPEYLMRCAILRDLAGHLSPSCLNTALPTASKQVLTPFV